MNANIFKTAFAALALLVAFNSCEKEYDFPYSVVQLKLPDGAHVGQHLTKSDFIEVQKDNHYASFEIMIGKSVDNITTEFWEYTTLEPLTKYYWYVVGRHYESIERDDFGFMGTNGIDTKKSEIRTFYVVDTLDLITTVENGEGEIGAIIHWNGEHEFTNVKITITPTVECGFAGKTIDVPNGQNSFFIKKSDNTDIPINLNDYDDEHGINYNPIIYSFQLTADVTIDESVQRVSSKSVNEILLNRHHHVRDHEFNVYRVVEVGNQYWLADDLRCTSYFNDNGDVKQLDYVISELPSGAKGLLYNANDLYPTTENGEQIIIDGYHIATIDDWRQLLENYGVPKENISTTNVPNSGMKYEEGYYSYMTIPECDKSRPDYEINFYDSITDIAYLKSQTLNLWKDIFASASDWVDSTGRNVSPSNSVFNIKPFGCWDGTEILGEGIGTVYYADKTLISFYYKQDGVGYYPTATNFLGSKKRFLPIRLVKDK